MFCVAYSPHIPILCRTLCWCFPSSLGWRKKCLLSSDDCLELIGPDQLDTEHFRSIHLDGTLGKLPGPGNSSRSSISCAWGHDRCLAAAAWVRPSSKQALELGIGVAWHGAPVTVGTGDELAADRCEGFGFIRMACC